MSFAELRREYALHGFSEREALPNPFAQFSRWFDQALAAGILDPNAMTLATATTDGRPSARIVLLKKYDETGLVFFTNYRSRKGRELTKNPCAALLFFWPEMERQIRVEGVIRQTTADESDAYFQIRPIASRIGAAASPQSEVIASREELEQRVLEVQRQYPGDTIPRPPHWGGFRLTPGVFEFWQGRPSRLHDRLEYVRRPDGWDLRRLAP